MYFFFNKIVYFFTYIDSPGNFA